MKIRYKKTFTVSLLSIVLLLFAAAPAMAVTYSGPNSYAPWGGPHDGTVNYGSGHYWVLDSAGTGTYTMSFTNNSSRLLDVVIYVGGSTVYSNKLGAGTHTITYTPTSAGNRSLMVFNGVLDGSFASASYSFMYN